MSDLLLEGAQLLLEFSQRFKHDRRRWQRTSCLDVKVELSVVLIDPYGFFQFLFLGILDALVAKVAFHDVFDLDSLAQSVK